MKKIDLVTGLLGAGKTTFLIKYARYLLNRGEKIGIIAYDYGAVNVDRALLNEALGSQCEIEMVLGGDTRETHARRLRAKLISFGMQDVTRVIIEPSGVFDPDELFDLMREDPLERWYELGSVIAVADAGLETPLSREERYLLVSQLAPAGKVLFSKAETGDPDRAKGIINSAMREFNCPRRLGEDAITKPWDDLTDADFEKISACGYQQYDHEKLLLPENGFDAVYLIGEPVDLEKLKAAARRLFSDPDFGKILRIKGFARADGGFYKYNATPQTETAAPAETAQEVVIVIGEGLSEEKIKALFRGA